MKYVHTQIQKIRWLINFESSYIIRCVLFINGRLIFWFEHYPCSVGVSTPKYIITNRKDVWICRNGQRTYILCTYFNYALFTHSRISICYYLFDFLWIKWCLFIVHSDSQIGFFAYVLDRLTFAFYHWE